MLNKHVCKRCRTRFSKSDDARAYLFSSIFAWSGKDESMWKHLGVVDCTLAGRHVVLPREMRVQVDGDPPLRCPYETEHVVSQDAEQ